MLNLAELVKKIQKDNILLQKDTKLLHLFKYGRNYVKVIYFITKRYKMANSMVKYWRNCLKVIYYKKDRKWIILVKSVKKTQKAYILIQKDTKLLELITVLKWYIKVIYLITKW